MKHVLVFLSGRTEPIIDLRAREVQVDDSMIHCDGVAEPYAPRVVIYRSPAMVLIVAG
jgi:hypothetical protein